jgi:hypothetical protein
LQQKDEAFHRKVLQAKLSRRETACQKIAELEKARRRSKVRGKVHHQEMHYWVKAWPLLMSKLKVAGKERVSSGRRGHTSTEPGPKELLFLKDLRPEHDWVPHVAACYGVGWVL